MNSFIVMFCCTAVAFTSGSVIRHVPSGSAGVLVAGPAGSVHASRAQSAGIHVLPPSGHQDNTWSLQADQGEWEHADTDEWNEDGTWNSEEEKKWDEEEQKWDNEEQSVEHGNWHNISKRQAPARKVNNAPEGRWNKELERYEYTSPRSDEGQYNIEWKNDNIYAPIGAPAWTHGFI